jgi:hypothetical protein
VSVARHHDPSATGDTTDWRPGADDEPADRPRTVGRYVLWGVIGSGGCATVHLGRLVSEGGFSRTVAVKRLHSEYSADPDFVAMFLDEARLAGRIHHPNVVQSLDVLGSRDANGARELFMIMDYVEGETLSRLVSKGGTRGERPPVPIVLSIMSGVLRGLHAAHEARSETGEPLELVHRDVSPQNVVVGVDGVARLLDFGIAKAIGRVHTTRQGDFKGKAAYMAPEQIVGSATKLSDVYAASVVLWEALTGRRLFKGENQAAVLHQVAALDVASPCSFAPDVAPAIEAIVMRGLARNPGDRFGSALVMAEALEKASPLASHSDVGAWVRRVARDELAERAAKVALIEGAEPAELISMARRASGSAVDVDPSLPITRIERAAAARQKTGPPKRWGARAAAVALFLIAVGIPLGVRWGHRSGASTSAEVARRTLPDIAPATADSNSAVAESAPRTADSGASDGATPEPTPAPPASVHSAGSHNRTAAPSATPHRAATPANSACTPPFLIDSAGRMHFKTECL